MNPKQWHIVKKLFHEAVDMSDKERKQFLKRKCEGMPDMKDEVLSLLAAKETTGPVDHPPESLKKEILHDIHTDNPEGTRIGAYRLIKELGRGGMGRVYMAERADDQFDKIVALKLLKTGIRTDRQVQKFLDERQILAGLNHPNIATLMDGGITNEGQPWFAMEYVDGKPITTYCDDKSLTVSDRLRLFSDVCNAVQFAHQNLVIHRDLKPSNILVTETGVVKLLDFGIARVTGPESYGEKNKPFVDDIINYGTPAYTSPEQICGRPVTTASDIYQLGVILYELLTNRRPYSVAASEADELKRIICNEYPPAPGQIANEKSNEAKAYKNIAGSVRAGLDSIVLKAIQKEPVHRYQSAEQFKSDIKRYLDRMPVKSHPNRWTYRSRLFIGRNTIGVTAAAIITCLIIVYAISVTQHTRQTRAALDRAEQEAEKSEQVIDFMISMFEAGDPSVSMGDTMTAGMMLEKGVERAEQLSDQPDVQSQIYNVAGRVYHNLGENDKAVKYLKQSVDLQESRNQTGVQLADTYYHLGSAHHHSGNYRVSNGFFEKARHIYDQESGHKSAEYAGSLHSMAEMQMVRGDYGTAEKLHRQSLAMRRAVLGASDSDVGVSLAGLGETLLLKGNSDSAAACLDSARTIFLMENPNGGPKYADALLTTAQIYMSEGNDTEAEKSIKHAIEIQTDIFGEDHLETVISKKSLADFYREEGEVSRAESIYTSILSGIESGNVNTTLKRPVVQALGQLYVQSDRFERAERYQKQTVQLLESILSPVHKRVLAARHRLAKTLVQNTKYGEAEEVLKLALARIEETESQNMAIDTAKRKTLKLLLRLYKEQNHKEKSTRIEQQLSSITELRE